MLKKDLIVRQLEEFGKVMAAIFGFKKEKDWDNFQKEIEAASIRFTAIELQSAERMTADDLKELVLKEQLKHEQIKMLADLLFEKMNFYLEHGNEQGFKNLRSKCIFLYEAFNADLTQNEFNLESHFRLDYLKKIK